MWVRVFGDDAINQLMWCFLIRIGLKTTGDILYCRTNGFCCLVCGDLALGKQLPCSTTKTSGVWLGGVLLHNYYKPDEDNIADPR